MTVRDYILFLKENIHELDNNVCIFYIQVNIYTNCYYHNILIILRYMKKQDLVMKLLLIKNIKNF